MINLIVNNSYKKMFQYHSIKQFRSKQIKCHLQIAISSISFAKSNFNYYRTISRRMRETTFDPLDR